MAVVTRYTVSGGEVLSRVRSGARADLVPDPQGSVVRASGSVAYSASYWPYGEARSSTGPAPCALGHLGTLGYYGDGPGRSHVRARALRRDLARWQTADPLWPRESAYGYAGGNPTTAVDPSGMKGELQILVPPLLSNPYPGNCGSATFVVRWHVTGGANGLVVQRVCIKAFKNNCAYMPISTTNNPNYCFYEAWVVTRGSVQVLTSSGKKRGRGEDTFQLHEEGDCTIGGASIEGDVRFIEYASTPDLTKDKKWIYNNPKYLVAPDMPTRDDAPPYWNQAIPRRHFLGVTWNCCILEDTYKGRRYSDSKTVIQSYDPEESG